MNILPINKVILASFAFALSHWKKVLEVSVIPLIVSAPFLLILPDILLLMDQVIVSNQVIPVNLPENLFVYLLLFMYGYSMLSINVYKLVILGESSVNGFVPLLDAKKLIRFIGLTLIIGFVTILPVMLTGWLFLQLAVYFLIVPLTLNFVAISIDQPFKHRWSLSFATHLNLFLLQALLPALVSIFIAVISDTIGIGGTLDWVVKVVIYYWTLVNLALCYRLINNNNGINNENY
jgi:hypothetical protein